MPTLYVISPPREIFEGIRPEVKQHIVMQPDFLRYPSLAQANLILLVPEEILRPDYPCRGGRCHPDLRSVQRAGAPRHPPLPARGSALLHLLLQPRRHHLPPSCRRTASHPRPRIPPDELRPLRSGTLRNGMYRTILPLSRTPARQHRLRLLLLRPAQRPRRHAATPPHTP